MNSHTSVTTIADALRSLADELEKTPVADVAPVWLQVHLQVVTTSDRRRADRYASVDRLASVLALGRPEEEGTYAASGERTSGAYVSAYTGVLRDEDNPRIR